MKRLAVLTGLAGALLPLRAWSQALYGYGDERWGHPMMDWGWGYGGMFLGPVFAIFFLGLTIGGAVLLVRWLAGPGSGPFQPRGNGALDILRERFARGEIDKAEFEERRRTLAE